MHFENLCFNITVNLEIFYQAQPHLQLHSNLADLTLFSVCSNHPPTHLPKIAILTFIWTTMLELLLLLYFNCSTLPILLHMKYCTFTLRLNLPKPTRITNISFTSAPQKLISLWACTLFYTLHFAAFLTQFKVFIEFLVAEIIIGIILFLIIPSHS